MGLGTKSFGRFGYGNLRGFVAAAVMTRHVLRAIAKYSYVGAGTTESMGSIMAFGTPPLGRSRIHGPAECDYRWGLGVMSASPRIKSPNVPCPVNLGIPLCARFFGTAMRKLSNKIVKKIERGAWQFSWSLEVPVGAKCQLLVNTVSLRHCQGQYSMGVCSCL